MLFSSNAPSGSEATRASLTVCLLVRFTRKQAQHYNYNSQSIRKGFLPAHLLPWKNSKAGSF